MKKAQPKSKALTANPKDAFGNKKVSFTKVSSIALAHCAAAMMDGADKYGPHNWRDKPVIASIYVDAAIRHLLDWFEGQDKAKDSGVKHLGHAMACPAILIDAEAVGALIDDRPIFNDPDKLDRILDELAEDISARRIRYAAERAAKEKANGKQASHSNTRRKPRRGSSPRVRGKQSKRAAAR